MLVGSVIIADGRKGIVKTSYGSDECLVEYPDGSKYHFKADKDILREIIEIEELESSLLVSFKSLKTGLVDKIHIFNSAPVGTIVQSEIYIYAKE